MDIVELGRSSYDFDAVHEWAIKDHRPGSLVAFNHGPEQQIAIWIEWAQTIRTGHVNRACEKFMNCSNDGLQFNECMRAALMAAFPQ